MKYYIASSSLNIDNILSSESISPCSFYSKRDFGYRTFQKIDNISINNSIVLFSELPFFEIQDFENENYPMVIEIEDDFQLNGNGRIQKVDSKRTFCDIYLYDKTIYLNPWNCRILFFSPQAMKLANLKCEDSLCNKMSHLFRIESINSNETFELSKILNGISFHDFDIDIDKLAKDNRMNRLKGFLYGYYLGVSRSLPKDVGQLLGIQKRIYNLIASIISNKNGRNEQFETKIKILDKEYDGIDPHKKKLRQLWEEEVLSRFSSQNDKDEFEDILKEFKVASDARVNFAKSHRIPIREIPFSSNIINWIAYRDSLSNYTENIINENKKQCEIDLIKKIFIQDDYTTISLLEENAEMYNKILKKIFFGKTITIEDLRLRGRDITKEIVSEIKSIIESKGGVWDENINDDTRYLKDLQRNIIKNEPFDLQSTSDIFLLSIAAFILKGEDYEALIRYLEENGVSEYSYVLGLWGAACGYVDMPKTIFGQVIKNEDIFCETYKSIHYLLLKEKLNGRFPEIKIKSGTRKQGGKEIVTFSSRMNEQQTEIDLSTTDNETILLIELSDFEEFVSREKIIQKEIITKLNEIGIHSLSDWNEKKVDSIKWTTKKGQKKLVSTINKSKQKNSSSKANLMQSNSNLFVEEKPLEDSKFYKDKNALLYLAELLPNDKRARSQFKTDIEWFQDNHNEIYIDKSKGSQQGIYYNKPTDNKSVIERFERYLENKQSSTNPNTDWLRKIYQKIDIPAIIFKLKELYNWNEG